MSVCAVIMAGGNGSRLWPVSRAGYPKQLLSLYEKTTMLQSTVLRLTDLPVQSSITVCNEENRFMVAEQLRNIDALSTIILEPEGRNTAPTIALAALEKELEDPVLLVLAADHIVQNQQKFTDAIAASLPLAESGKLVMFGIVPTDPQVGFGYIERGSEIGNGYWVKSFREKPPATVAQEYLDSGHYYWNSGIFMFRASRYLEELQENRPDIVSACRAAMESKVRDLDFLRVGNAAFAKCPTESIDCAVMEQTIDAVVVPMDAGWSDIGSWSSLADLSQQDDNGNTAIGDVKILASENSYVRSEDKLVAAIGVSDLVIVSTKDAVLVASKDDAQDVKRITQELRDDSRKEWRDHREVFRPWGKYDTVDAGEYYQVKRVTVNPGAKLSLQMHHHRAEHWVVVSGSAKVTNGDETFLLSQNESTYIPIGVKHSLENPDEIPLEIIEVQSGCYLGEDDIIRFEDNYGRS
ncbi:MAG: mannose-1-phosphate guanylyltransferase/mannose-6-phosphate isomerase [Gammaproteobacteria bacterium]|nr:mannose-1-phosphate guanylyltransferase/mannose-6-phosphate isomerase [Gammaproteobacteria bacterium]